MTRTVVLGLTALLAMSSAGCNPCESLEEKLCGDLGAEDCGLWRAANGPDVLYSGRRSFKFCVNARFGLYDTLLQGARDSAAAMKAAAKR